ncbi:MAG: hypothetical protein QOF09_3182 [Alphaproteobacteria bacterium]|nr:hypothetical protein [Alphaproteobacteria bacterium]
MLPLVSVHAADLPLKAPNQPIPTTTSAVDGFNSKFEGLGGSFADKSIYGAKGSLSIPLGGQFGAQVDGAIGSFDNRTFGIVGGHLFWRNPAQGLIGIYANHTTWDRYGGAHVSQVAGEGELYSGRWTLQGIAGVEFGNTAANATTNSTTVGSVTTTTTVVDFYDVKTRFFDQVNLAYYIQPDWKAFVGHRYLGGKHALAAGTEWAMPLGGGRMASLFAEGRIGEDNFRGIWGGGKFYFGQKDKTLIQRHRQDDPINWTPDSLFSILNSSGSVGTRVSSCPFPEVFVNGTCQTPRL